MIVSNRLRICQGAACCALALLIDMSQGNRHSLRLREYECGATKAYFVTGCPKDSLSLLGEIDLGYIVINELGDILAALWSDLPHHFPNIQLDYFSTFRRILGGDGAANEIGRRR